jgi:hypothetical protein
MSSEELVEATVGINEKDVAAALSSGRLRGMRLPSGQMIIARTDALAYRRLQERALRREFGW